MKNTQKQKKVTSRKMTKLRRCFCSYNKTFKYRTEKQKNSDKITKQQNKQQTKDYQMVTKIVQKHCHIAIKVKNLTFKPSQLWWSVNGSTFYNLKTEICVFSQDNETKSNEQ